LRLPTCAATGGRVVTTRTRGGRVACGVVACAPSARRRAAPTGDWGPLRAPPNSPHRAWREVRVAAAQASDDAGEDDAMALVKRVQVAHEKLLARGVKTQFINKCAAGLSSDVQRLVVYQQAMEGNAPTDSKALTKLERVAIEMEEAATAEEASPRDMMRRRKDARF